MAIENMEVLNRNGFDITVDDSEDRDPSKPRLGLVGQPVSKSVTFDVKGACEKFHFMSSPEVHFAIHEWRFDVPSPCLLDLEELLSLMHDRPTGQMVRCSKVRAMFASRACRKSVMIGDSLNHQQMVKVRAQVYEPGSALAHQAYIDSPTHEHDRTALELSTRPPNYATPV